MNYQLSLLKNNKLNKRFKHDAPLLGALISLIALEKEFTRKDLPLEQVVLWQEVYLDWREKRTFNSEKANKYNAVISEVFDELKSYASAKVPKDFWVTEEKSLFS